ETLRYVQREPVAGAQLDRVPAQPCRRALAQVNDHVPDRPPCTTHQLRLLVRLRLEVQSTQRRLAPVPRQVALRDDRAQAAHPKFFLAEGAREKAALVLEALRFDQVGAGERDRVELHSSTRTCGIGTTKRPPQERTCAICATISSFRFQGR